jgi:hypothetical protein
MILMWAVYIIVLIIAGARFSGDNLLTLFKMLASPLLLSLAYSAVASIIAFGTQKSTIALSVYLALGTGLAGQLLALLLSLDAIKKIFGNIAQYTIENIVGKINASIVGEWIAETTATEQGVVNYTTKLIVSDFSIFPIIQYIVFFGIAVILAAVAFRKKELEF